MAEDATGRSAVAPPRWSDYRRRPEPDEAGDRNTPVSALAEGVSDEGVRAGMHPKRGLGRPTWVGQDLPGRSHALPGRGGAPRRAGGGRFNGLRPRTRREGCRPFAEHRPSHVRMGRPQGQPPRHPGHLRLRGRGPRRSGRRRPSRLRGRRLQRPRPLLGKPLAGSLQAFPPPNAVHQQTGPGTRKLRLGPGRVAVGLRRWGGPPGDPHRPRRDLSRRGRPAHRHGVALRQRPRRTGRDPRGTQGPGGRHPRGPGREHRRGRR